ncbi:MAG: SusC/RagA family TonB-linked outer membrane protein, partial [Selenomonadaceae bacterium]
MLTITSMAFSQTKTISGLVTSSEDGQPLIGVTVLVKGSNNGTITNIEGSYIIKNVNDNAALVFSMIGMKTIEVTIKNKTNINIVMEPEAKMLEQLVVTGYTSQKKADLTGAVSVIDIDDIKKSAENNPIKSLQGRVAGMTVTADGNPSGSASIRIRGIGTLNNNDPLLIIDGVPTKGGMHELNSNDIESIQVLKDAAAASIYGSRAGNGVIIITTKQGKTGKMRVDFDSYVTATTYNNHLDVLNSKEYGQAMWQAAINSGSDPNNNNIGYRFDWNYDAESATPVLTNLFLPKYLDAKKTMHSSDTDWFDEVSRTGIIQSYNLSASNGTEKGKYFFSLGYFENEGTIKFSKFDRISARVNSDYKLLNGLLTIGENFTLNRTSEVQSPGDVLDLSLKALPMVPVHTIDGVGWGGPSKGMNDRQNPVRLITYNKDNPYRYWRTFGNAFADLEPVKDLHFRTSMGIDYGNFFKRYMQRTYESGFLSNTVSGVNLEQSHSMKWNWTNTAAYKKSIGNHS